MKILFAAIPAYGHLYPLMPLALACAEAGHDVTVACGKPFLGRLPLPTIPQQPDALELDGVSPKPPGVIPACTEPNWWSGCSPTSPPKRSPRCWCRRWRNSSPT